MAKPNFIQLTPQVRIPILYEDRAILAIDKPLGWMLAPLSWQKTTRNLTAALLSSLAAGHFWARSRNLKFFRHIHRLDAETSGILLFAKSVGALETVGDLFEQRRIEKIYFAVVDRPPPQSQWTCRVSLTPDPDRIGRMKPSKRGKTAETDFKVLAANGPLHLIEARPYTGRTHQIRVHLAEAGCPIVGDPLYGAGRENRFGLRAVGLGYRDPFTRKAVRIRAPANDFLKSFGFDPALADSAFEWRRDPSASNATPESQARRRKTDAPPPSSSATVSRRTPNAGPRGQPRRRRESPK